MVASVGFFYILGSIFGLKCEAPQQKWESHESVQISQRINSSAYIERGKKKTMYIKFGKMYKNLIDHPKSQ